MTTQDSQSELDEILDALLSDYRIWSDVGGEHPIAKARLAMEAYVTTRVKEARNDAFVDGFHNGMKRVAGNALTRINSKVEVEQFLRDELQQAEKRLEALTTTTNGKEGNNE